VLPSSRGAEQAPIDFCARLPRCYAPSLVAAESREQRELLAGKAAGGAPRGLWALRAWTWRIAFPVAAEFCAERAKLPLLLKLGAKGLEGSGAGHRLENLSVDVRG